MARALMIVNRCGGAARDIARCADVLNRRLTPDNITPALPQLAIADGVAGILFNASANANGAARIRDASICIGVLVEATERWHEPGAAVPDGCYALLRADRDSIELVADAVASRTIWYVLTPELFVASTSQRAIVSVLGEHRPNPEVVPWMLSSGTLGPGGGWDTRIRRVLPGERVTLDRGRWRLAGEASPVVFAPDAALDHGDSVLDAVDRVCAGLGLDASKWILPLSGGVDSRGLLLMLRDRGALETITWGLKAATRERGNDAQVAGHLARHLGVAHRYLATEPSNEPKERLIHRFLTAGEGRVAKISGYVDGFAVWRTLHEERFDGIIRGDQAFGSPFVRNAAEVRRAGGLTLLSDCLPASQIAALGLADPRLPEPLMRRDGETLERWRDRLYQQHRVPVLLASLTDLKSAYVEVISPLLARRILACVRRMPDELRTDKRMWRELVRARGPRVPFARRPAVMPLPEFLGDDAMLELMLAELESPPAADPLPPALRRSLCATLRSALSGRPQARRRRSLRSVLLPAGVRAAARRWVPRQPVTPPLVLAFRAFVVSRMNALLSEDAAALSERRRRAVGL